MSYVLSVLILIAIYVILAMSLNMVVGYSGLVALCHAASMAIGGYTAALLAVKLGLNIGWGFLAGALLAGLVALAFGYVSLRFDHESYVLATFAFQMVVLEVIIRWSALTGGAHGLRGIPRPQVFGVTLTGLWPYFVFVTCITAAAAAIMVYLGRSPFGLVVRGTREGIRAVESLGRDTFRFQLLNFSVAGAMAGLAGGLYISMLRFGYPGDYNLHASVLILIIVIAGGNGNLWGAIPGAVLMLTLPQVLSFLPFIPSVAQGPLQQILYGLILMLFIWLRPQGIVPERPVVTAAGHQQG